jgi:hypothetical protein
VRLNRGVISYTDDLTAVREDMLHGFFVGWPRRPSPAEHLAVLRASYRSWPAPPAPSSATPPR